MLLLFTRGKLFSRACVHVITRAHRVLQRETWGCDADLPQSCHFRQRECFASWVQNQWGLF